MRQLQRRRAKALRDTKVMSGRPQLVLESLEPRILLALTAGEITEFKDGVDTLRRWGDALDEQAYLGQTIEPLGVSVGSILDVGNIFNRVQVETVNYFNTIGNSESGLVSHLASTGSLNGTADGLTLNVTSGGSSDAGDYIRFTVSASRTVAYDLDEIVQGTGYDMMGVRVPGSDTIDITTTFTANMEMGITGGNFYVKDNSGNRWATVTADINYVNNLNAGIDIGFLGGNIVNGTIDLDVDYDLDFVGNVTRATLQADIDTTSADIVTQHNVAANDLAFILPIVSTVDGTTFNTQIHIGGVDTDVFTGSRFAQMTPTVNNGVKSTAFAALDANTVFTGLQDFGSWLGELADDQLMGISVPWTNGRTLGDVLPLETMWTNTILEYNGIVKYSSGDPTTEPDFSNATEFYTALQNAIVAAGGNIGNVSYDYTTASNTLSYTITVPYEFDNTDPSGGTSDYAFDGTSEDVTFSFDVGYLNGLASSNTITVDSSGSITMTLGYVLEPDTLWVSGYADAARTNNDNNSDGSSDFDGNLYAGAGIDQALSFDLVADGQAQTITVSTAESANNASFADLVTDIQTAVNAQFGAGKFVVDDYNGVVRISSTVASGYKAIRIDVDDSDAGDVAASVLGLQNVIIDKDGDGDTLYVFEQFDNPLYAWPGGTADAVFKITYTDENDVSTAKTITVTQAATVGNTSMDNIIADVQAALDTAWGGSSSNPIEVIERTNGALQFRTKISHATFDADTIVIEYNNPAADRSTDTAYTLLGIRAKSATQSADSSSAGAYYAVNYGSAYNYQDYELSTNASFVLNVDGVDKAVTVTTASTVGNTSLSDLIDDVNTALQNAGVTKVEALSRSGSVALRNVSGQTVNTMIVKVDEPGNLASSVLGFLSSTADNSGSAHISADANQALTAIPTASIASDGRLSANASFTVTAVNSSDNIAQATVTVSSAATAGNNSLDDLAADIETAINTQMGAGSFDVYFAGGVLQIVADPADYQAFQITTTEDDSGNTAATQLGFEDDVAFSNSDTYLAAPNALSMSSYTLTEAASFTLILDGTTCPVSLAASAYGNEADFLAALNTALSDAISDVGLTNKTITATVNAGKLRLQSTGAVTIEAMEMQVDEPIAGDSANTELGLMDGSVGHFVADMFVQNTDITAAVSVTGNALTITGNFGGLGFSSTGSSLNTDINVTLARLVNYDGGGNTVTIDALLDGIERMDEVVPTVTLTEANDTDDLVLTNITDNITAAGSITGLDGAGGVTKTIFVELSTADVTDTGAITLSYGAGLEPYIQKFRSITETNLESLLDDAGTFLSNLSSFQEFAFSLPFLDQSVSDALGFSSLFADRLSVFKNSYVNNVQTLEANIEAAFGLEDADVAVTIDTSAITVAMDWSPRAMAVKTFALNVAELAADDSVTGGLAQLLDEGNSSDVDYFKYLQLWVDTSGQSALELDIIGNFNLDLGIDLSNPDAPDNYIADTSTISVTAILEADDLTFSSSVGGAGIYVRSGVMLLDKDGIADAVGADDGPAEFTLVMVNDAVDGKYSFSENGNNIVAPAYVTTAMTAAVTASLPLFAPSESERLSSGFELAITDLAAVYANTDGSVEITSPDLAGLVSGMDVSEALANPQVVLEGLRMAFQEVQTGLTSILVINGVPILDTQAGQAVTFVEDMSGTIISSLNDYLSQLLNDENGVASTYIQQSFWASLNGSLGILQDTNSAGGVTIDDIVVTTDSNDTTFEMLLGGTTTYTGFSDFDIGLDALDFDFTPGADDISLVVDWQWNLAFGVNLSDGFYLISSGAELPAQSYEMAVSMLVTLDCDATVEGDLFYLPVQVENVAAPTINYASGISAGTVTTSYAHLEFEVDVRDSNSDGKYTMAEMVRAGHELKATAVMQSEVELAVNSYFGGSTAIFPTTYFDFNLDWGLNTPVAFNEASLALPSPSGATTDLVVQYIDVSMEMGALIDGMLVPIFTTVDSVLDPIRPILDILTDPIPVISDLAGDTSLLDIANALGNAKVSAVVDFITYVDMVSDISAAVTSYNDNGNALDYGSFTLQCTNWFDASQSVTESATNPEPTIDPGDPLVSIANQMDSIGVDFPLLTDPSAMCKLLTGRDAELIVITLPEFELGYTYRQKFPIFSPLYAQVGGTVGMTISELYIGYDTSGFAKYHETGDFKSIADGFYISDTDSYDGTGTDVNELSFTAGVMAGASLSMGVAEAGVEGGIFIDINFDLFDPNLDGKIRMSELLSGLGIQDSNDATGAAYIFDINGRVYCRLYAYLEIDLWLFSISKEWDFCNITLWTFDTKQELRTPILASPNGNTLYLNMGPRSEYRQNYDIDDDSETFNVSQVGNAVSVTSDFWGTTQTYNNITNIVAYGGAGNDTLNLTNVTADVYFDGGSGNDTVNVTNVTGNMTVYGGTGNDTINTGSGNDIVYGQGGNDTIKTSSGTDSIYGGTGNDEMWGGDNNDGYYFEDDFGVDVIYDDTLAGHGGGGNDTVDFSSLTNFVVYTISDTRTADSVIDAAGNQLTLSIKDGGTSDTLIGSGNNNDKIIATDANNDWRITGMNMGSLNADLNFQSIENLIGGQNDDIFTLSDNALVVGTIDGGAASTDKIDASAYSSAIIWDITRNDGGVAKFGLGNMKFKAIENIDGGQHVDQFILRNNALMSGTIDGNGNDDRVDLSSYYNDELKVNVWDIYGPDKGEINKTTTFQECEFLIGGQNTDHFLMYSTGSISGGILGYEDNRRDAFDDGVGDSDIISFLIDDPVPAAVDQLQAALQTTYWYITGENEGYFSGVALADPTTGTRFQQHENLSGGPGVDIFIFAGGNITGTISGGGSSDQIQFNHASHDASVALTVDREQGTLTYQADGSNQTTYFNMTDIEKIVGSSHVGDTLVGENSPNEWYINAADTGNIGGTFLFEGIENLTGGTGNDTFHFNDTIYISGTVNGGVAGVDEITLASYTSATAWTVNADNAGSMSLNAGANTVAFAEIETVTGGTAADTFTFSDGVNVSTRVNGYTGSDTLDYSAYTSAMTWAITANNSGTINGSTVFSGIENITTGSANDEFVFSNGKSISGDIDAGTGSDKFNYTAYDETHPIAITVDTGFTMAGCSITGVGGTFTSVENIIAGSALTNTLNGANVGSTWNITGNNSGNLTDGVDTLNFWNIQAYNGGTAADTFVFSNSKAINGTINAGTGQDTLNYSAYTTAVTFLISSNGGGNVGTLAFSGVENLIGTTRDDTFEFFDGFYLGTDINGHTGDDTIDFSDFTTAVSVNQETTTITYAGQSDTYQNIENIIGGSNADTLIGQNNASTWYITDTNAGTYKTILDFTGFENITGGTAIDTFIFSDRKNLTGTLTGGTGDDVIDFSAHTLAQTFAINANSGGTIDTMTFAAVENLIGTAQDDTFEFADAYYLGTSIDGSTGSDTLDYSDFSTAILVDMEAFTVTYSSHSDTFQNIEAVTGGTASDTFVGPNSTSDWQITDTDAGTLNTGLAFSGIENLTGGTAADTFAFADGKSITGNLTAGTGTDIITYAAYTTPIQLSRAAMTTTGVGGVYSGVETLVGGQAADTLIGNALANSYVITADQAGTITGNDAFTFSAVENLTAGSASDILDFSTYTGDVTVDLTGPTADNLGQVLGFETFVGSSSQDTIVGANIANTWTATAAAAVSVNGLYQFTSFENLTGGTAVDTITYASFPSAITINLADESITGFNTMTAFETIIGSSYADTIIGADADNVWKITADDTGLINDTLEFIGIETLTGGSANDTFQFANGATIAGTMDGKQGSNTLDYSPYTTSVNFLMLANGTGSVGDLNFTGIANLIGSAADDSVDYSQYPSAVTVNLDDGTMTALTATQAIENLIGSSYADTIIGSEQSNSWDITGTNTGAVTTPSVNWNFTGFENLTGGADSDTYNFTDSASVTGTIDGKQGTNTLNYAACVTAVTFDLAQDTAAYVANYENVTHVVGSSSTADLIIAANVENQWNITADNAGTLISSSTINFSGIENLQGNAQPDTFTFTDGKVISGTLDGAGDVDLLDFSDYTSHNVWTRENGVITIQAARGTFNAADIEDYIGGMSVFMFDEKDLTITLPASNVSSMLSPGETGTIPVTVTNRGNQIYSGGVDVNVYLSLDAQLSLATDILVGSLVDKQVWLNLDSSGTYNVNFALPDNIPLDSYRFIAVVDPEDKIDERNEVNNTAIDTVSRNVLLRFGELSDGDSFSLTVPDNDGHLVTFSIQGPGTGEITDQNFDTIVVHDTDATSVLSITVASGQMTNIGDLSILNDLATFNASAVNFTGDVNFYGGVKTATIGTFTADATHQFSIGSFTERAYPSTLTINTAYDTNMTFGAEIASLTVAQLLDSDDTADTITADTITKMLVTQSPLNSELVLSGQLGELKLSNELTASIHAGSIGTITVTNASIAGDVIASGLIERVEIIGGDINGRVISSAGSIGTVSTQAVYNTATSQWTGGDINNIVRAAGDIENIKVTNADINGQVYATATLGLVEVIGGDINGSIGSNSELDRLIVNKSSQGIGGHLYGRVDIAGVLNSVTVYAGIDAVILAESIGSITAESDVKGTIKSDTFETLTLKNGANLSADINITGDMKSIITYQANGLGGNILPGTAINIGGTLDKFTIAGSILGDDLTGSAQLTIGSINTAKISGDVENSFFLLGTDYGDDGVYGGVGDNQDTYSLGYANSVTIIGDVVDSIVAAGLLPDAQGNYDLDYAMDNLAFTVGSYIKKMTIGGNIVSTADAGLPHGIATYYPITSLKVAGRRTNSASQPLVVNYADTKIPKTIPTSITIDNSTIAENDTGAVVGSLSGWVDDHATDLTYEISSDMTGLFEIIGNTLQLKSYQAANYEAASTLEVVVKGTHSKGGLVYQTFTIAVTDAPESPTDIALDNDSVAANLPGTVIGNLATTDPDAGDTFAYAIADDSSNGFEIVNNALKLKDGQTLTPGAYQLSITSTDSTGNTVTAPLTVTITEPAYTPTNIQLSNLTVAEIYPGLIIGQLQTDDQNVADAFTYTITSDPSGNFEVVSNLLKLKNTVALDYETANSYPITIQVSDRDGLTLTKDFTITVTDLNDAPTKLTLSQNTVAENATAAVIGTFSTEDHDAGDTFTYDLTYDPSNKFEIVGNQLQLKADTALDYEIATAHYITVTVTDANGLDYCSNFMIQVENLNDTPAAPENIVLSHNYFNPQNRSLPAIKPDTATKPDVSALPDTRDDYPSIVIGQFSAHDPNGSALTYQVINDPSGLFTIPSGNQLVVTGDLSTVNDGDVFTITVRVTNEASLSTDAQFTILANDLSSFPQDITLTNTTVLEEQAGITVGTLATQADDQTDYTYTLTADASNLFEIVDNVLKLKDGIAADYEAAAIHNIVIQSTNTQGLTVYRSFDIAVADLPERITLSTAAARDVSPGQVIGTLGAYAPDSDNLTYYIVNNVNNIFVIDGDLLRLADDITSTEYLTGRQTILIGVLDEDGQEYQESITIDFDQIGNVAPAITVPDASTINRGDQLTLTNITVTDASTGPLVTATVSTLYGTITLSSVDGLTFTQGDGSADQTMTFTATLDNLNAALAALSYQSDASFLGANLITISVDDADTSTDLGNRIGYASIAVTSRDPNEAPTVDAYDTVTYYSNGLALNEYTDASGIAQFMLDITDETTDYDVHFYFDQDGIAGYGDDDTLLTSYYDPASNAYQVSLQVADGASLPYGWYTVYAVAVDNYDVSSTPVATSVLHAYHAGLTRSTPVEFTDASSNTVTVKTTSTTTGSVMFASAATTPQDMVGIILNTVDRATLKITSSDRAADINADVIDVNGSLRTLRSTSLNVGRINVAAGADKIQLKSLDRLDVNNPSNKVTLAADDLSNADINVNGDLNLTVDQIQNASISVDNLLKATINDPQANFDLTAQNAVDRLTVKGTYTGTMTADHLGIFSADALDQADLNIASSINKITLSGMRHSSITTGLTNPGTIPTSPNDFTAPGSIDRVKINTGSLPYAFTDSVIAAKTIGNLQLKASDPLDINGTIAADAIDSYLRDIDGDKVSLGQLTQAQQADSFDDDNFRLLIV